MATIGLLKSKNTFTWRVKNFLKRPEKNSELILSPKFTIFDNYGRQFTSCLSLYPKGMLEYEGMCLQSRKGRYESNLQVIVYILYFCTIIYKQIYLLNTNKISFVL